MSRCSSTHRVNCTRHEIVTRYISTVPNISLPMGPLMMTSVPFTNYSAILNKFNAIAIRYHNPPSCILITSDLKGTGNTTYTFTANFKGVFLFCVSMTMIVCIVGVNVNCRYRLLRLTQIGRDLTTDANFRFSTCLSFNSFLFFFLIIGRT